MDNSKLEQMEKEESEEYDLEEQVSSLEDSSREYGSAAMALTE